MDFLERFYRVGARVVAHMTYRLRIIGFQKNIPAEGPAIIIANHVSYMDGMLIHTAVKNRRVHYVIDQAIYNVPAVKYFMDICGSIPIEPTRESVEKAFVRVAEVLKQGDIVCIFPEGSLSYTGNLNRFRFGIEHMAKDNQVSVIPVVIKGMWGSIFSRKYMGRRFRWLPRRLFRKVTLICGKPIDYNDAKVSHLQKVIMDMYNHRR